MKRRGAFEVYARFGATPPEWGWRLVGGNGEKMAGSEGYTSESDAYRGAKDAKRVARFAKISRPL